MKTKLNSRKITARYAGAVLGLLAVSIFSMAGSIHAQNKIVQPQWAQKMTKQSVPKSKAQQEAAASTERANANLLATPAAPDTAANYVFTTNTTGSLTNMSSGTTQLVGAGVDDGASAVTSIGFDFYMLGTRYTQFSASSNGYVRLGATGVSTTQYTLGTANAPLITAMGSDEETSTTGKVHYKVTGTAPNRVLTIEYLRMTVIFDGVAISPDCTSQVRLHETTGEIELVYGSMTRNASMGFQGGLDAQYIGFSINSTANNYATVNTANVANTTGAVTANQFPLNAPMASLDSAADGSRRVYDFTPAIPTAPTSLTFTSVTPITMTLNWVDSPDESLYVIYRSTDGVNYSFVGTAAANATSFNAVGLSPTTNYFWQVFAVSDGAISTTALTGSQVTATPGMVSSTAAGGLWSAPGTWAGGAVPLSSDDVTIVNGATVTVDTAAVALDVVVQSGGALQWDATTARTLTLGASMTIDSGGTFASAATGTVVTHVLSVGGNLTNNGTLDFSTNADTAGAGITFTGATSNTFGGTGATTDIRAITMNKGTSNANVLEMSPTNFTVRGVNTDVAGYLTITNGTFKVSGTFSLTNRTFAIAAYAIPANGGLWMNNPNYTVAGQNGTGVITGMFRLSQGNYNVGTATGNSLNMATGSNTTIEGGSLTSTGRFAVVAATNTITYTQTGGTITVCTIGNASTTLGSFDLGTSASTLVNMSGGTITCQLAGSAIDYRYDATPDALTGGTLQLGNANSGAAKTFNLRGVMPKLIIDTTSAGHSAVMSNTLVNFFHVFTGDIVINTGGTLNLAGNATSTDTFIEANVLNNGTLNASNVNMAVEMVGTSLQTYSGTGVMTPATTDMDVDGGGVNFTCTNQQVVNRINLFSGSITGADKLTLGNGGATAAFFQIGNGGPPATIVGAVTGTITNNAGTGGYTIFYGDVTADRNTGGEIPASRSVTNVTFDSEGPNVTIAGGDLTVTGATIFGDAADVGSNGRVITGSNTLIVGSAGTVSRVGGLGHVDGNFRKTFTAAAALNFEVGTANGYSPVSVNATAGTFPADFTAKATQMVQPNIPNPTKALQRYWTLTGTGLTADLTFNYLDPVDIPGTANESNFVIFKYDGALTMPGGSVNTVANTATITGVTAFSDWTLAEPAPASPLTVASAVSRKTHGAAGDFDINLPLTGSPGIECRNGGGSNAYTVIVTFSNNVVSGSASVTAPMGGSVSGLPTFSGNMMTISLTGITDLQQITVNATNVMDEFSQVLANTAVPMKVLQGDSAGIGNSSVGTSDIGFVKSVAGPVSAANFRADVAVNGAINTSDIGLVKSKSGNSLP